MPLLPGPAGCPPSVCAIMPGCLVAVLSGAAECNLGVHGCTHQRQCPGATRVTEQRALRCGPDGWIHGRRSRRRRRGRCVNLVSVKRLGFHPFPPAPPAQASNICLPPRSPPPACPPARALNSCRTSRRLDSASRVHCVFIWVVVFPHNKTTQNQF